MMISNELNTAHHNTDHAGPKKSATGRLVMAHLRSTEVIVIETKSSTYTFTLLDPVTRRGLLRGGLLGAGALSVKMSGMIFKDTPEGQFEQTTLCCGGRAIFHITSGSMQNNYLVTSIILGLTRQQPAGRRSKGSESPDVE